MEAFWVVVIIVWLVAAAIVGSMGSDRKIGFATVFLISLLLTPIIGALVALGSDKIPAGTVMPESKQKAARLFESASKKAHQDQLVEAIADLVQAVAIDPQHSIAYFNLACLSSRLSKKDDAFRYLALAVERGYNTFANIQVDKDLEFLRAQPEFAQFATNGYRMTATPSKDSGVLDKLERLAALREKGVLTEQEFQAQKAKILGS